MFTIDASSIDRSLPVPVGKQLHGLLSYVLSFGDMPKGVKLQSVRQLAAELDIAPMTVAEVYKQLRSAGLVEIRPGLGAFTVYEPRRGDGVIAPASVLSADIDSLLEKAEALGISPITLASMVQAQAKLRKPRIHLNIVFVGDIRGAGTRLYRADPPDTCCRRRYQDSDHRPAAIKTKRRAASAAMLISC